MASSRPMKAPKRAISCLILKTRNYFKSKFKNIIDATNNCCCLQPSKMWSRSREIVWNRTFFVINFQKNKVSEIQKSAWILDITQECRNPNEKLGFHIHFHQRCVWKANFFFRFLIYSFFEFFCLKLNGHSRIEHNLSPMYIFPNAC